MTSPKADFLIITLTTIAITTIITAYVAMFGMTALVAAFALTIACIAILTVAATAIAYDPRLTTELITRSTR